LAARAEQNVCHTSYVNDLGWKSTTIKAEDPLYKGLLLIRAEL
jgi:hypothetical protein